MKKNGKLKLKSKNEFYFENVFSRLGYFYLQFILVPTVLITCGLKLNLILDINLISNIIQVVWEPLGFTLYF